MSIEKLGEWLQSSKNTVILTGAGMSTESGIPDFRSVSGWWNHIDPRTVATTKALTENYALFHEFYKLRLETLDKAAPHEGHSILANWEQRGIVSLVATQNVDGFHQLAGSQNVEELHGSIRSIRCHRCQQAAFIDDFKRKASCSQCGGTLRPNVVLFGESLPQKSWHIVMEAIKRAELVLVIGTSLEVYPVNQLPMMTKGKTVYINLDTSQHTVPFDMIIEGKIKEVLLQIPI
ncbi:NAD-dependent deacylase [Lysinibacillus fusiformis]|uniref:SIR2 family NAD-dependent protein deacylase n=1 Tax=Lysinibacillus fusiformis TaxID=28031 RepID=UPI003018FBBB